MQYNFQWDRKKAHSNFKKHGVTFRLATQIFRDPLMMTRFDDEHSNGEDRWISLGQTPSGFYLVVAHTHHEHQTVDIRIISARSATKQEIRQYEGR